MQTKQENIIYIATLRLDTESQAYFDHLRDKHFPPARNYLKAHLTLFHQLPDAAHALEVVRELKLEPFDMHVVGLLHLGAGVAYQIESAQLQHLHAHLSAAFAADLIPQDKQRFKPHITVQNKVTPEVSKQLLAELRDGFHPFTVRATGLDLWIYLDGPWRHMEGLTFKNPSLF